MIDVLVGAGANDIGGINFTVTQASKHLDEAREKAIADARRKAEIYAKAAGVTLGEPISISEEGAPGADVSRQDGSPDGRRRTGGARRRDAFGDGERVLGDQGGAVAFSFAPHIGTDLILRSAHRARLECDENEPRASRRRLRASLQRDDGITSYISTTCPGFSAANRSGGIFASLSASASAFTGASIASSVSWNVP